MTEPTPYQQRQRAAGGRRQFPAAIADARRLERTRRHAEAQRRARLVLQDRHRAEYDELYAIEKAALDAERGPLPGDDHRSTP